MALSTYLPLAATLAAERAAANAEVPIFMAHGSHDDIIPIQRAQASREMLQKVGYKVEWHDYPMPHSVCGDEVGHIAAFLTKLL